MEFCDEVWSVLGITIGYPAVFGTGVSPPLDEVMKPAADILGVEDFLHFILFASINNGRPWFWVSGTLRYFVWSVPTNI
jgi:hypothetical protein